MTEFGLCPEECFAETLELLTAIAGKGGDILPEVDGIWLRKYNEYRRFDRSVSADGIRQAVAVVFGFTILAVNSSRHPFYRRTLAGQLTQTVARHNPAGWASTLGRIFGVPLPDGWFDDFIGEEQEDSGAEPEQEQDVVAQLASIFYGSRTDAEDFLRRIRNMKPAEITQFVNKLVKDKKISDVSNKTDLWKILHDNRLYTRTLSNWCNQVK